MPTGRGRLTYSSISWCTEPWRVPISHGLLHLVFFRMPDGKKWCAPELSVVASSP
jgi:hypothetical protein